MKFIFFIFSVISLCYAWNYITYSIVWAPEWISRNDIILDNINNKCNINTTSNCNYFIIHGMWPDYNNGSFPSYCNLNTLLSFNITKLQPIIWYLNLYWNNFRNTSELWEHEYYKHYSCARSNQYLESELDYFKIGLILYNRFNIQYILSNNGVLPDNSIYYRTSMISDIIEKKINSSVIITCPNRRLTEVRICINKKMDNIDCPNVIDNCKYLYIKYDNIY
jgi:ribonuclease T2